MPPITWILLSYCVYHFEFTVPVGSTGDNYDRYLVRIQEMRESNKIIGQCVDWLRKNPGPVMMADDKIVPPNREEMKNENGDFNTILNVLTALRQEDPYIFELCLKYPEKYTEKEISDNLKKHNVKIKNKKYPLKKIFDKYDVEYKKGNDIENIKLLSNKIKKNIQIISNDVDIDDVKIDNHFDKTMIFIIKQNIKFNNII